MTEIEIEEKNEVVEAIKTLLGNDYRTQTELSMNEIRALSNLFSTIDYYRKKFNINLSRINQFVNEYIALKISYKRKSRTEVVKLFNTMYEKIKESEEDNEIKKFI